jgi:hypothetical protein
MIELDKFQGHIVLYCKCHYNSPDGEKGFFEGLKKIWAVRCGYDYSLTGNDTLTYIADDMYNIISACMPDKLTNLMSRIHREINPMVLISKPKDMIPIEAIIWEYRSILSNLQVKRKHENKDEYIEIVKLPDPMPEVFNRILAGKGEYGDYKLIELKLDSCDGNN